MGRRYVIIGAGAIGGAVAGLLAEAGVPVVAVARGEHARAMADRGVTLRMPDRSFSAALPVALGPDDVTLTTDDVLVLTTKTHQAEAALRAWVDAPVHDGDTVAGTVGEALPIVTALNGVASEDLALRFFDRVLGACIWMPAVFLEPGEIIVRGTPLRGTFHVAPVPVGRDESAVLDAMAADWGSAELRIQRPDDVMPWKYRKLITNLGNVLQALLGPDGWSSDLATAAIDEARAILDLAGVEVTDDETERAERRGCGWRSEPVPGQPEQLGGSSWQSLARGTGDIETDFLNGEIAMLARRHGTTAPVNAALTRLARQAAREGWPPGHLSADDLATHLATD